MLMLLRRVSGTSPFSRRRLEGRGEGWQQMAGNSRGMCIPEPLVFPAHSPHEFPSPTRAKSSIWRPVTVLGQRHPLSSSKSNDWRLDLTQSHRIPGKQAELHWNHKGTGSQHNHQNPLTFSHPGPSHPPPQPGDSSGPETAGRNVSPTLQRMQLQI